MTERHDIDHPHDHDDEHELEDHDRGLGFDLQTLRHRRAVLGLLGAGAAGVGAAVLLGSGGSGSLATAASAAGSCTEIPEETAGPYPGDGSNGPDVLTETGIVRRDIRSSFGSSSGRAAGVPFRFTFELQDADSCQPVTAGLAVYAWHCNRDGKYSMYSEGVTDQNYLRGVQITNAKGRVRFRSIYPACYSGRWPHVHFEVYRSRHAATHGGDILVTSQMALGRKPSMHVYRNAPGYGASVTNLEQISLKSDNVFGDDGGVHQLATMSGSIERGYHARLVVPVSI